MSEKSILAYFKTPEEAEGVSRKLRPCVQRRFRLTGSAGLGGAGRSRE